MSNASKLGQTRIELWDAQKEIKRLRAALELIARNTDPNHELLMPWSYRQVHKAAKGALDNG